VRERESTVRERVDRESRAGGGFWVPARRPRARRWHWSEWSARDVGNPAARARVAWSTVAAERSRRTPRRPQRSRVLAHTRSHDWHTRAHERRVAAAASAAASAAARSGAPGGRGPPPHGRSNRAPDRQGCIATRRARRWEAAVSNSRRVHPRALEGPRRRGVERSARPPGRAGDAPLSRGDRQPRARPRHGRAGRAPSGAIWLILPVIICLSQRLSHACLSSSRVRGETADGSLNRLWIHWGQTHPWITCGNSGANTCNKAPTLSSGGGRAHLLGENQRLASAGLGGRHPSNCRRSHGHSAGDACTEFLIYHAVDGWCYANRGVNG